MQGPRIYSDYPQSARILAGTYLPPRGQHLDRATAYDFVTFLNAYICLWLARREAGDQQIAPHENAVPVSHLHRMGVLNPILLWMWYQGHVDHCLWAGRR